MVMKVTMKLAMVMIIVVVLGNQVVSSKGMSLCNLTQDDLITCKPAVTKVDPPIDPTPECCTALKKADFDCLCSYKNSMMLPSFGIDPDRALQLPDKCKIPTTTKCTKK
ncbi:hypothetical protein MKX01_042408 [Papaver californicum]|nr:hypothetical protein MKX01_042408 [Papaver californicum]